jgi:hypothetical protein
MSENLLFEIPPKPITKKQAKNKKFVNNHTNLQDDKAAKYKALNGLEMVLYLAALSSCKFIGTGQITRLFNSGGILIGYVQPDTPDKIATIMGKPEDDIKIYFINQILEPYREGRTD